MSVTLIILELQFITLSKEVLRTGTDKSTGTVALDLSSLLFPRVSHSSKGHSKGPRLAYDTDPQTGTHSGPGICL